MIVEKLMGLDWLGGVRTARLVCFVNCVCSAKKGDVLSTKHASQIIREARCISCTLCFKKGLRRADAVSPWNHRPRKSKVS
jgi:hypothetical protein